VPSSQHGDLEKNKDDKKVTMLKSLIRHHYSPERL